MDSKQNSPEGSRIVFVVGTLESGGIERLVMEWSLYLQQHTRWTPSVICILEKRGIFLNPLEDAGIRVLECKLKNAGMKPFVLRMAEVIKNQKANVVHSQVAFSLLWQTIAFVMGGSRRIIFTQHNEYQNWNSRVAKLRLRSYYFFARPFIYRYTCVSNRVKQALVSLLGVSDKKFMVIHNSVNTALFRKQPELRSEARKRMGVSSGDFCIGIVANYSKQKGHVYALEACAQLKKEISSPFKLVLIGNGDFQPAIDLAQNFTILDDIIFLGKRTDVDILFQGMDCFVLPSLWEGMPLSLLEAMACQVPVIATNVSGTQEVLRGETGLLVEAASARALTDAIINYVLHPELAKEKTTEALKDINARFALSSVVQQYLTLYQN